LREKLDLEELIECRKTDFKNYKNTIDTKRSLRENEWMAEKADMAKKNETAIMDMAARQAAVEQQLQEQEIRRQEEKLKGCLDKKRLCNVIDELRTKLRDQAIDQRNVENAWTMEREALNEKYSTLESEVQFRQTIHDARLENEQRRQEQEKARAAEENESGMIGAFLLYISLFYILLYVKCLENYFHSVAL
jgi:hypothetical protein